MFLPRVYFALFPECENWVKRALCTWLTLSSGNTLNSKRKRWVCPRENGSHVGSSPSLWPLPSNWGFYARWSSHHGDVIEGSLMALMVQQPDQTVQSVALWDKSVASQARNIYTLFHNAIILQHKISDLWGDHIGPFTLSLALQRVLGSDSFESFLMQFKDWFWDNFLLNAIFTNTMMTWEQISWYLLMYLYNW